MKQFSESLDLCNKILQNFPNYNIALYHKERILFSMKQFTESIECCDIILKEYPKNLDVLFDKACSLNLLNKIDDAMDILELILTNYVIFKAKIQNSKQFENLKHNIRFQKLIS